MKLEIGDVVEFKNYENMTDDENMWIDRDNFPESGKIAAIGKNGLFIIEGYEYIFNPESVARVISDVDDVDSLKKGDEVLVKATIKKVFNGFIQIDPSIGNSNVTKILKRKEPEHFIVKEDYYGMYIGTVGELVSDKSKAKIYTSRNTANEDAADMYLSKWEAIPYGN